MMDGVRTVPQFVFKLMVKESNSTILWIDLRNHCGCERTLYGIAYLSQEPYSQNKWHFSEKEIPVGVSCRNRNAAQCRKILLQVKKNGTK